jgi:hypothetical protein
MLRLAPDGCVVAAEGWVVAVIVCTAVSVLLTLLTVPARAELLTTGPSARPWPGAAPHPPSLTVPWLGAFEVTLGRVNAFSPEAKLVELNWLM